MAGVDRLRFRHRVIDPHTVGTGNSVCLVTDVNSDGFTDVIIGNFVNPPSDEGYLVWYEYQKWKRHIVARANLESRVWKRLGPHRDPVSIP